MRELPKYLYHYTTAIQLKWILEDLALQPSPSNLFMDDRTRHIERMFHKGKAVGKRSVDKYAYYHPVVWLTANDAAAVEDTGLSPDKLQARIVFLAEPMRDFILHWPDFTEKYHASPTATQYLKETDGRDWENWFVCEGRLGLGYAYKVELRQADGSYKTFFYVHEEDEEKAKADEE